MQTIASVAVKNNFGRVSNTVKSGEAVAVTQYGTPTMMILPFKMAQEALQLMHAKDMIDFMNSMPPVNAGAPELSTKEITTLVHDLRA
jgi:antitoxin (DNA-binding transcriptional repressor) of toxin-antitoxin stability system